MGFVLYGLYSVVGVTVMLNMLIGMMASTYGRIEVSEKTCTDGHFESQRPLMGMPSFDFILELKSVLKDTKLYFYYFSMLLFVILFYDIF